MLLTKAIVYMIIIDRSPPSFLWWLSRTAANPVVFSDLVLLVSFFLDSGNVDIGAVEKSQQISNFSDDSVRVPLRQS